MLQNSISLYFSLHRKARVASGLNTLGLTATPAPNASIITIHHAGKRKQPISENPAKDHIFTLKLTRTRRTNRPPPAD